MRPARRLKTADARLKRLLDEGQTMRELYRIKEALSAKYAREWAKEEPSENRSTRSRPTGRNRAARPKTASKLTFRSQKH